MAGTKITLGFILSEYKRARFLNFRHLIGHYQRYKINLFESIILKISQQNPNLLLSGQLDPASPTAGVFDSSLRGTGSSFFQDAGDSRSATDYSLPTPHRLSVDIYVAGSNGESLVNAAASSAVRSPEMLRSIFSQKWSAPTKTVRSTSSSATCPIQLLAVSLIMSDETVLPAHQVPPNYLRISSLDSNLVWDPAIPMQPAISNARSTAESSSTSVHIRVNSLIAWTQYVQTKQENNFRHSVPLSAMDDVVLTVQSGHVLRDPGPPQDPSRWFSEAHETPIDRRESVTLNNHNAVSDSSAPHFGAPNPDNCCTVFIDNGFFSKVWYFLTMFEGLAFLLKYL